MRLSPAHTTIHADKHTSRNFTDITTVLLVDDASHISIPQPSIVCFGVEERPSEL